MITRQRDDVGNLWRWLPLDAECRVTYEHRVPTTNERGPDTEFCDTRFQVATLPRIRNVVIDSKGLIHVKRDHKGFIDTLNED